MTVIKNDFRSLPSAASGFGTLGARSGTPFVGIVSWEIPYRCIDCTAA
jgi:hypothetical protein